MSKELLWLTLTVVLTGLLWIPYIIDRAQVRGALPRGMHRLGTGKDAAEHPQLGAERGDRSLLLSIAG